MNALCNESISVYPNEYMLPLSVSDFLAKMRTVGSNESKSQCPSGNKCVGKLLGFSEPLISDYITQQAFQLPKPYICQACQAHDQLTWSLMCEGLGLIVPTSLCKSYYVPVVGGQSNGFPVNADGLCDWVRQPRIPTGSVAPDLIIKLHGMQIRKCSITGSERYYHPDLESWWADAEGGSKNC